MKRQLSYKYNTIISDFNTTGYVIPLISINSDLNDSL